MQTAADSSPILRVLPDDVLRLLGAANRPTLPQALVAQAEHFLSGALLGPRACPCATHASARVAAGTAYCGRNWPATVSATIFFGVRL